MLKGILSRYSLSYPKKLVYMLQATEYYIGDYFSWYLKTVDFSKVEKTGKLVYTKKAIALLCLAWKILISLLVFALITSIYFVGAFRVIYLILFLLLTPYFLACLIVIPVVMIKYLIQKPVELFIAGRLAKNMADFKGTKIAIAGSYGKTSMREILRSVLSEGKKVAAPGGSINTLLGIDAFTRKLKGDEEILIFELGEYYPGDIRKLARIIKPDIGIITGINEAHLKRFKTIDRTVGTIFELADELGSKPLYVNSENELAIENAKKDYILYILYSRDGVGEWEIAGARSDLAGTSFVMKKGQKELELSSKLLGLHQIGPLAVAVDIASKLGLTEKQIIEGVQNTEPFKRRLEFRLEPSGVVTLDDSYNGNPDGVKAVIDFLASLKDYRRFYVTSGLVEMGKKNKEIHLEIGRELAKAGIEKVILVKTSATPFIAEGLKESGFKGEISWYKDSASVYTALPHLTAKGDLVLLQNNWPDQYR